MVKSRVIDTTNRRTRLKAGLKARQCGVSRSARMLATLVGLHIVVRIGIRQAIYRPRLWRDERYGVEPILGTERLQTLRVYKKKLRKTLARLAHATGIPCYLSVEPPWQQEVRRGLWHAAIRRIRPVAQHLRRGGAEGQRMTAMVVHRAFGRHVLRQSHRCTADAEQLYSGIWQVLSEANPSAVIPDFQVRVLTRTGCEVFPTNPYAPRSFVISRLRYVIWTHAYRLQDAHFYIVLRQKAEWSKWDRSGDDSWHCVQERVLPALRQLFTDGRDMYRLAMFEYSGRQGNSGNDRRDILLRITWQWSIAPIAIMIFCRLNVPADLSHAIFGFSSVDDCFCCHRWYTTSDAGMTVRNPAI